MTTGELVAFVNQQLHGDRPRTCADIAGITSVPTDLIHKLLNANPHLRERWRVTARRTRATSGGMPPTRMFTY